MAFSSESNSKSGISRNSSADFSYIEKNFDALKKVVQEIVNIESRITSKNYDVEVSGLYSARERCSDLVQKLNSQLSEVDEVSGESLEVYEYLKVLRKDEIDVSIVRPSHVLVGLRVKLIESWFALKKVDEEHPLYWERKTVFLECMERAVRVLRKPMDFEHMYELYAEDVAKLRSLVVSYFMKRSRSFYIKEFNRTILGEGESGILLSLVLKEFSIFSLFKSF